MIIDRYYFKSEPKKSPFAVEWEYVLAESPIDNVDFDKIAKFFLAKEKELMDLPMNLKHGVVDGYTGLGVNSLTSRYGLYNVFQFCDEEEEIKKLRKEVFDRYCGFLHLMEVPRQKVWIQSWCNIVRSGQSMKPHIHNTTPYCYLGGHITVQCENTSTVYINPVNQLNDPEIFDRPNRVGKFTIFQANIPHYTTEHKSDKERITFAIDFILDDEYKLYADDDTKKNILLFDNGEVDGNKTF